MNELAIALGLNDAGPAENGQVLRGHGLFQAEVDIQLGYGEFFMLIQYPHDLLTELMIQGTQDHRCFFEVDKINLYRCVITTMCVYDHPVITDRTVADRTVA